MGPAESTEREDVLFIDDDADLRGVLGAYVSDILGRRCLGAAGYDELLRLGPRALRCGLAVIDVNLGPGRPSGVDAYDWLMSRGFQGRVVFLTGHGRSHPAVDRALRLRGAPVFQKPMPLDVLSSLVRGDP